MGVQLPVPIVGIDTDNDGAFINETLASYCREQKIAFTRSRVQQKNDQAWIEQKNSAVIRRMAGHDRLSGRVAGQALAQLLQLIQLYVNFFQPSFKLRERVQDGAKVRKVYHVPATPCVRLPGHPGVSLEAKDALRRQQMELDPANLLHRIRLGQSALATLSTGHPVGGPIQDNLKQFLAKLPDSWRMGEVRPTHQKEPGTQRGWRTRKDPFEWVWPEILKWLQNEPDGTTTSLLNPLIEKYPDRRDAGQLGS